MSFGSHVSSASLVSTHTSECLILACDIVSDVSHLHSFVNLRMSSSVSILSSGLTMTE